MILPGIFEKDFEEVRNIINKLGNSAEIVQIDIADGKLVDGLTFQDATLLNTLPKEIEIDLHLLVENPLEYLKTNLNSVVSVCAQIEAHFYIEDFIVEAKKKTYKVGLSIAPDTDLEELIPYLEKLDYVQFMTIKPGGQGRPFIKNVIEKIKAFHDEYPQITLQADGGINEDNIELVSNAGVENFVIGHRIVAAKNPAQELQELDNFVKKVKI